MSRIIGLDRAALGEALELDRAVARLRDELHVAQNEMNRYITQFRILNGVPVDYVLINWVVGFEPAPEEFEDGEQDDQSVG